MNYKNLSLLIVSETALFSDALGAQLQQGAGFSVKSILPEDVKSAASETFLGVDLVIVTGAALANLEEMLRSKLYQGPILFASSEPEHDGDQSKIRLPVRYPVFLQKIRSLIGSFWYRDDLAISIGPFLLRPAFKDMLREGKPAIALTDKEVEILIYLYRAGGKIISRDVLLAEIWGYNAEVSTHTLETHIYRLRQKIEIEPEIGTLLMTEVGGYRLTAGPGE